MNLQQKYVKLQQILQEMGSVAVAFSGGVDSTFLLKVAHDLLGEKAYAITYRSVIHPEGEFEESEALARQIGASHYGIGSGDLSNEEFVRNDPERCYYCKKGVLHEIIQFAKEHGLAYVIEGSNYDDLGDYRPGKRAVDELGVRSPLLEAELTKKEIRELSRQLGLPTWDKPSFACLTSRIPYGERITEDKLRKIDVGERNLKELGFKQYRVRYHDARTVRIEILPEDMQYCLENRDKLVTLFKEIGFTYVTLDLVGYRTGSMNEVLSDEVKQHG